MENGFDILTSSLVSFLQEFIGDQVGRICISIFGYPRQKYLKVENHYGCGLLTYNKNQRWQLL